MQWLTGVVTAVMLTSLLPVCAVFNAAAEEDDPAITTELTEAYNSGETIVDSQIGGIGIYKDGNRVNIEAATGAPWDEPGVNGDETPTLPALSAEDFYSHATKTIPESEHLYTLTAATGIRSGDSVEYFAVRYTDVNNVRQTKYIFPKVHSLKATNNYVANLMQGASAVVSHAPLKALGYSINESTATANALQPWSVDEYFFKTENTIKKINSVDVFLSGNTWSVQGLTVSRVTGIGGYGEYGYYSGKYFLSLDKQYLCRLKSASGGTRNLPVNGDTLISLAGEGSSYFTLEEVSERSETHDPFSDLFTFRMDFADALNGGLESLLRTDSALDSLASGPFAEDLALEIEYKDANGWTRNVNMPVLLSVIGQSVNLGDSVRTIGLAQRGDTLAFTACLPECSNVISAKLHVGKAASDRLSETGGISGGNSTVQSRLDNDYIMLAGISVYKGTCRMSNFSDGRDALTNELLACYSYGYSFSAENPTQYYTTGAREGKRINPGTTEQITLSPYQVNSPLLGTSYPGNFLVRVKIDSTAGAGSSGGIQIRLAYTDFSGTEQMTGYYNAADEMRNYIGYWPSVANAADNFGFLYGASPGNYIEFPVDLNLDQVAAITNVEVALNSMADDVQIAGVSVSVLDMIGNRRIYAQNLTTETASSKYRIVRTVNHTVLPPFPIDTKLYISPGDSYSIATGTSSTILSGEVDYNSLRYSMSYEDTKRDFGFVRSRIIYDVTVKVADDPDRGNVNGDSGSKNHFYFQLQFKNGSSAFVLANQQLSSDGFRAGYEEMFSISVNRDYSDIKAVRIIPEDISEDSDVFDKLNIESITITERANGGAAMQYVVDTVGWIGIDFHDKAEDSSVSGREGRYLSELASTYPVSYQRRVVNLLCEISALPWDINYFDFKASIAAELVYLDTNDQPQTIGFDVVSRMYDYSKRPAKFFDGASDGSQDEIFTNMGTITDGKTMLRPGHTDRFILPPLADAKTLKSITLYVMNRSGETAKWCIGGLSISRIISDTEMVTLEQSGTNDSDYYREMDTSPLCQMVQNSTTNQEQSVMMTLPFGQRVPQKFDLTEAVITYEERSSWTSAVTRLPDSTNDTLNIYLHPTSTSRDIAGAEVSIAVQYAIPFSKVMQVKQGALLTYGSGTPDAMFYFLGLSAPNMQTLNYLGVTCRNSRIAFDYALVTQIRDNVVVATYDIPLNNSSATLGLRAAPSSSTRVFDRKKQVMQLSFGERTEEMTLFGPGDNGTNVNDIAVCFKYKSILDIGYGAVQPQYYSPYVYLTDVGIDKISPGMMAEIPFDIPYVSEITGYRIVSFGNITADVKGAVISNYSYRAKPENADSSTGGDVLEHTYSMADVFLLANMITEHPVTYTDTVGGIGALTPLELTFKTAKAGTAQESGTDTPVAMVIDYVHTTNTAPDTYAIPDLRLLIQGDDKTFATDSERTIRLFLYDCAEITALQIQPLDETGLASWTIESINGSLLQGSKSKPISREVNQTFDVNGGTISMRTVQLRTEIWSGTTYEGAVTGNSKGIMAQGGIPVSVTVNVINGEGFDYLVEWIVNDVPADVTQKRCTAIENGFVFTPLTNESSVPELYRITITSQDNPNIKNEITVTVPAASSSGTTPPIFIVPGTTVPQTNQTQPAGTSAEENG